MTCVVCVQKMEVEETGEGSMKRSKCIFRKCQSWGTGILERDDGEGDDDEEVEDNHDANCYTCEEGGGTFRWLCSFEFCSSSLVFDTVLTSSSHLFQQT